MSKQGENAVCRKIFTRGDVMLPRKQYMNMLISKRDNGRIKVITGLRRSGKSVLLFQLYKVYLLNDGVKSDQIIEIELGKR